MLYNKYDSGRVLVFSEVNFFKEINIYSLLEVKEKMSVSLNSA